MRLARARSSRSRAPGGILEPHDLIGAALFLLSDETRMITRQVLDVDGGWSVNMCLPRMEAEQMLRYASAVTISRAPADVFPYLADPVKQALYSDVPMREITPGVLATGSRMEVMFGMGPLKATIGLEVTAAEENTRMAFDTYSGPIRWQGEYLLKPTDGGGTNLSHEGTMVFTGLWRLLEPLIGAELKRNGAKEMERLKAAVEQA